jgi:hypothetical protein
VPNPFSPSFGVSPPLHVGRDDLIDEFVEAVEDGQGAAGRATLYRIAGCWEDGPAQRNRGSSKRQGLACRVRHGIARVRRSDHTPASAEAAKDFDPGVVHRRLSGFSLPLGPLRSAGVNVDTLESHVVAAGLRNQIELLTDILIDRNSGVLITLDEIHQTRSQSCVIWREILSGQTRTDSWPALVVWMPVPFQAIVVAALRVPALRQGTCHHSQAGTFPGCIGPVDRST